MCNKTLIGVVWSYRVQLYTRGDRAVRALSYNPEEPEFTVESFGFDPLQSTGREWNYLPVDELIYQEYSDRGLTSLDYLAPICLNMTVIHASTQEENKET